MKHSDQLNEIAFALAKAQSKIKSAAKTNINPHFKSKYADLASIRDACSDALTANDIAVVQAHGFDGDRFVLTTRLIHKSGQWLESVYLVKPTKEDPQGYASATTYARRISLSSMVGVVADDDDDGNAASAGARESEEDSAKQAAKAFVTKAIREVGECKTTAELTKWHETWNRHVVKLRESQPDEAKIFDAAFSAQREFLSK